MAKLKAPFALDRSLNTTEQTSRNIADVLAEELSAIITALGGLNFINYEVVEELPTTGISTTTIYLVPSDDPQSGNTYDEYINLNGTVSGWEKIGSTAIDLSGYYTSAETDALLDEKVDKDSFDEQTATDEFTTINGGLLSECKVALSPIQDLHGYSEPWVGGAGKNLWGGNVTVNNIFANAFPIDVGSNSVTISLKNASGKQINCRGYDENGSIIIPTFKVLDATDTSGSYTLTLTQKTYLNIVINGGVDADIPKVTEVQIEKGSTATSYEPYSNICPIIGHTEVKVGDDGKNKADPNTLEVGYYSTTGYNSSANFKTTAPISVEVGKTYFGTVFNTNDLTEKYDVVYTTFSSDDTTNALRQIVGGSITIQSGEKYVRVRNNSDHTALIQSGNFAYQLELGSTATPYAPYKGYQITVNLGGTYYSGTLDVVTGVFTPDTASVDLGTLTWTREQWGAGWDFYVIIYGIKPITSYDEITTAITEQYKPVSRNTMYDNSTDSIIAVMTNGAVKIRDNRYSDIESFTSAVSGVKLVYPLNAPTSIQLSPTMVKALVGENHISAPLDGQEITEVKYKKMFTFDDVIAYIQSLS